MSKVVLITGASAGIGKASSFQMKKDGYTVYSAARRVERMADLKSKGINVLPLDITDEKSVVQCVETIIQKEGRIDILVNNAGYGNFGTLEETPIETARAQYDVNVFGLMRLSQLIIPYMRSQKYGKIVNISSVGGKIVTPFGGWYQSTKFAVEAISDAMRMELMQFGIDVITIEPGGIESEWNSIAQESIMEISGSGPYRKSAGKAAKAMESGYKDAKSPNVIAMTISKSLKAKKPKTRYAAGSRAFSTLLFRKILSDKVFDRMIMREFI